MAMKQQAAYGSWASPIDARAVAGAAVKLGEPVWDMADGREDLYWLEGRPEEAGRVCIVRMDSDGNTTDCLPAPWSARSSVHEYGGGVFTVHAGLVWFVNGKDQAIYQRDRQGEISRVTELGPAFADLRYDPRRARLVAVCETHSENTEAAASLVSIDLDGSITTLASGCDFYASPRLSPDGGQLAWLCWDHPNMPWDGTELWAAEWGSEGRLTTPKKLAGGADESLFQPCFAPNGQLHVVSDSTGWWNIQRVTADGLQPVTHEQAEFGVPQWVFGQSTYGFDEQGRLYALFTRDGLWQLAQVVPESGDLSIVDLPFTHLGQLQCGAGKLVFLGGSASQATTLCSWSPSDQLLQTLRAAGDLECDESCLSAPESLDYPTANGETAHALYYPPVNSDYEAPEGTLPPLLIKCHGGPTGATSSSLDPRIQFWTSRGFAVLDVNYRGSTGYGRAYRQSLYGRWGVADVEDCVYGAQHLIERGLVDAERVVITGSSAGGYTVLCVLCFTDLVAAGASYYGIADLERLLASTHKFESRYLGRLIGEDPALLRERSPLYHAEDVACPVLFLQGLKDKVVPPDQACAMAGVLRERGIGVAHITFAEERHGFKAADNIVQALESELAFYAQVLGFAPANPLPPVTIDNLTA